MKYISVCLTKWIYFVRCRRAGSDIRRSELRVKKFFSLINENKFWRVEILLEQDTCLFFSLIPNNLLNGFFFFVVALPMSSSDGGALTATITIVWNEIGDWSENTGWNRLRLATR